VKVLAWLKFRWDSKGRNWEPAGFSFAPMVEPIATGQRVLQQVLDVSGGFFTPPNQ